MHRKYIRYKNLRLQIERRLPHTNFELISLNNFSNFLHTGSDILEFDFDDAEQKISPIINKIEKLFERKSLGKFEKWNVNKKLVDLIQNSESNSKISDPVCKKFEKLFKEINSKLV